MKNPIVYMRSNQVRGTIYVGSTSNLAQRNWQYATNQTPGFVTRYNLNRLVHVEVCDTMEQAILRERHLKKMPRIRKIRLIEESNPEWRDLSVEMAM